jgi:hypothetical protein
MIQPMLTDKRSTWPALILVGVVITLLGLVFWLWLADSAGPVELVAAEPANAMAGQSVSVQSAGLASSRTIASTGLAAASSQDAMSAKNDVFNGIDIKGHLYVATRAGLRKIVINDRTLREGEKIKGILVKEITETGVILEFQGAEKTISAY